MRTLRYRGLSATTFMKHGVGEVQPGDEFPVPDEAAEEFLGRSDIEEAGVETGMPNESAEPETEPGQEADVPAEAAGAPPKPRKSTAAKDAAA